VSAIPFRVSWYHFRATFHRRWSGYLAVILLVGLVGGVAMGAVAGARRTQSALPASLAATISRNEFRPVVTSTFTREAGWKAEEL